MSAKILDDIKSQLNISEDDNSFDNDLINYADMAFATLAQLGATGDEPFMIDENTEWDSYPEQNNELRFVKVYVTVKVKLFFDPPSNSALMEALKEEIKELEWRINDLVDYQKERDQL